MAITDEQQLQAALAEIGSLTAALERVTEDWKNAVKARDDWAERAEKAEAVAEALRRVLKPWGNVKNSAVDEALKFARDALTTYDEPPTEQA
jgi:hypothetical protein